MEEAVLQKDSRVFLSLTRLIILHVCPRSHSQLPHYWRIPRSNQAGSNLTHHPPHWDPEEVYVCGLSKQKSQQNIITGPKYNNQNNGTIRMDQSKGDPRISLSTYFQEA